MRKIGPHIDLAVTRAPSDGVGVMDCIALRAAA
jgi:hypothetical protein